jgi:chromosome partitioning protein
MLSFDNGRGTGGSGADNQVLAAMLTVVRRYVLMLCYAEVVVVVILVVASLKGGSARTTSAAYLGHVLHEWGDRVLLVDADPQRSLLRWAHIADWAITTTALPTSTLHREVRAITGDRFDAVVIDTPPLDHDRGIVVSALRVATHVVIPMAPTAIEYDRLSATVEAINNARKLRFDNGPEAAILFTRAVPNAAATAAYRTVLQEDGHRVLKVSVGHLQQYAHAYARPIERASTSAYGDACEQLLVGAPQDC